jgi:hypothetical protein
MGTGFPKVIKIRDRNYRRLSELEAWEKKRAASVTPVTR